MTILISSKNLIHSKVRDGSCEDWCHASWVYGNPYRAENRVFWSWISEVLQPSQVPWFCRGDLNEYLWDSEKSGGREKFHSCPWFLQDFMSEMEFLDLQFSGPAFTWKGIRNGCLVQERLDRGIVNGCWQESWPILQLSMEL